MVFLFVSRWRRETRIKSVAGRPQGEVAYYAPCGKKLRQYPDVMKVSESLRCSFVSSIIQKQMFVGKLMSGSVCNEIGVFFRTARFMIHGCFIFNKCKLLLRLAHRIARVSVFVMNCVCSCFSCAPTTPPPCCL